MERNDDVSRSMTILRDFNSDISYIFYNSIDKQLYLDLEESNSCTHIYGTVKILVCQPHNQAISAIVSVVDLFHPLTALVP